MCQPKDQGGLEITNLAIKNICMLSKWIFKLMNEDGIWQQLLHNKYLGSKSLTQVQYKPGDSQFWTGLMKVKSEFLQWGIFKVKNRTQVRFWEDKWLSDVTF